MQEYIHYGIDLGTTNSAIGQFRDGKLRIIRNPKGFGEIMPSAVAFRKGRVVVGDKALEQLAQNTGVVFTGFKRDMGTEKTFRVEGTNEVLTPLDLSTYVLKELLAFAGDEAIQSAVITIPASFDMVQSNATKKAGMAAGLRETVLLQEPIAACLAYANDNELDISSKQTWLVYDFGGGTFDSALVLIDNREMKVKDHLGNNFLGGMDIDHALLRSLLLPKLHEKTGLEELKGELQDSGTGNKLYQYLMYRIEEAKKDLSVADSTVLEIDFPDMGIAEDISITRDEMDKVVEPIFSDSVRILNELLLNNNLSFRDIDRIVLVGGTTYIPYIRQALKDISHTTVDFSIDPTTAIVKGAAYFAGTRTAAVTPDEESVTEKNALEFDIYFENTSNHKEELVAFKCRSSFKGSYRISQAGGFDSGVTEFKNEVSVFVPLIEKKINQLTIEIFDKKRQAVFKKDISISHGLYNISGQTLPLDICLEVDTDDGNSYLEPIFRKNSVLPLSRTQQKSLSKSVSAGSGDGIYINVLEGRLGTLPASNLSIGLISIRGTDISSDLVKGTNIELNFHISESRDLTIDVFIPSSNLTLSESFNPHTKIVEFDKLVHEIDRAMKQAYIEMMEAKDNEQYELASRFKHIAEQLDKVLEECHPGQVSRLYKAAEQKRALLKELDSIHHSRHIFEELEAFNETKEMVLAVLPEASPEQSLTVKQVLNNEKEIVNSGDKFMIRKATEKLEKVYNELFLRRDENFLMIYLKLKSIDADHYKDPAKIESLIHDGNKAMHENNYALLKGICTMMFNLMKDEFRSAQKKVFSSITGLR